MSSDYDWEQDKLRYPKKRPYFKEQSIWAIWVYRFGRRVKKRDNGIVKSTLNIIYFILYRIVETFTSISIPNTVIIGHGLRIWHFGGIFINANVVIGNNCTLRQGVTIGSRIDDGPVPVIGDNVDIGAYAQILGDIKIGDNCKIGAMTLVLTDIPDGATAVGVPARIIPNKNSNHN